MTWLTWLHVPWLYITGSNITIFYITAHNAVVTAAVFAPRPDLIYQQIEERKQKLSNVEQHVNIVTELRLPGVRAMPAMIGDVLVTADFGGAIYVFFNKPKVKLGSSVFVPLY